MLLFVKTYISGLSFGLLMLYVKRYISLHASFVNVAIYKNRMQALLELLFMQKKKPTVQNPWDSLTNLKRNYLNY